MKLPSKTLKGLRMINLVLGAIVLGFYLGQVFANHGDDYSGNVVIFPGIFAIFGGIGIILTQAAKKKDEEEFKGVHYISSPFVRACSSFLL